MRAVVDEYVEILDRALGIAIQVKFERTGRGIDGYAVVLVAEIQSTVEAIRVFDSAHGVNEMHRYTRSGGKQTGTTFHSGTFGEGMRAATSQIESGYRQMIEGWDR